MEAFTFDTIEQYLLAATGILFIVQALYYLALYNRINLPRPLQPHQPA